MTKIKYFLWLFMAGLMLIGVMVFTTMLVMLACAMGLNDEAMSSPIGKGLVLVCCFGMWSLVLVGAMRMTAMLVNTTRRDYEEAMKNKEKKD